MSIESLLVLQIILYHMTTAAIYNYNETSEEIPFEFNPFILSGFRNIAERDLLLEDCFQFMIVWAPD